MTFSKIEKIQNNAIWIHLQQHSECDQATENGSIPHVPNKKKYISG